MSYFLVTFAFMLIIMAIMAVGVMFGSRAIKGSCGGAANGSCVCVEKCDKRKKLDAEKEVSELTVSIVKP
ncbi:MAG: (Na+)-NQR maturation NqrM [Methylococcales symbiont of Hymedesmia sp. n. MRB-2018]|nr:MAG: (Na+)-NQR maturation NqrM [Methylococcales symbiont of Hymedesmia sp. n. MRB-2018]